MQLDEDNRLLWPHQVWQYADHFDFEGLDLVSSEDGIRDPIHSGFDLVQRKNGRLIACSANRRRSERSQHKSDDKKEQMPK